MEAVIGWFRLVVCSALVASNIGKIGQFVSRKMVRFSNPAFRIVAFVFIDSVFCPSCNIAKGCQDEKNMYPAWSSL